MQSLLDRHCPEVHVAVAYADAREAIPGINALKPDLIFLDIHMPEMNGFKLLEQLDDKSVSVIFTTAHERFALQAIKHHAVDYLLKPIDPDELRQAVDTVVKTKANAHGLAPDHAQELGLLSRLALPIPAGTIFLKVNEIVWVQSDGSYTNFHMGDHNRYNVSKNIGEYEDRLPRAHFFRIHKSHIINMHHVVKYVRTDGFFVEMSDGTLLEVSRRKKDEFLERMAQLG
jgi:two-component system, LytTR family, response regulator